MECRYPRQPPVGLAPEFDRGAIVRMAFVMAAALLSLAVNAPPAAAGDDAEEADCFFAENRDDPLCRQTVLTAAAPMQRAPSQEDDERSSPQDDDKSVDCFFAENRDQPLCGKTSLQ